MPSGPPIKRECDERDDAIRRSRAEARTDVLTGLADLNGFKFYTFGPVVVAERGARRVALAS